MRSGRVVLAVGLLALAVFGQEFQGTILGRITDSSGAVVPDVQVTVVNTETDAASSTKTNMQGNYRVPFLLPGDYRVLVEHPGFRKIERHNVRVSMATETTLANPFPTGLLAPRGAALGLAEYYGSSLAFADQNRLNPYNQQWQVGLQREVRGGVLVDAAYMGMHSLKQIGTFDLNEKPDVYLALGAAENNPVPNPFLGIFSPLSTLGQGATIINERPQWRGIASSDRPHKLRLAFIYQLPFSPGKPIGRSLVRPLARLVEGGTLSGYVNYRSGAPLSVSGPNGRPIMLRDPSESGPVSNRLGDQVDPKTGKVLNPYFDIDAFQALPNQYAISPEPPYRSNFRGPAAWGRNLSLAKDVRVWERYKLQIRCEASNFTNSVTWGNPGANMSTQATFGVISSGGGGRSIQMSAQLMF